MDKELEQTQESRQRGVTPPFHQRFDLKVELKDAQLSFVNRILNDVTNDFPDLETVNKSSDADKVLCYVVSRLGMRYSDGDYFSEYVKDDFIVCLRAVEALYEAIGEVYVSEQYIVEKIVERAISMSEIDLGIEWRKGVFYKGGAKLLDEALVNENLRWLSDPKYSNVLAPFEKGLRHFLEAQRQPERLADTITDMYEALEALARIVTGEPRKNLGSNANSFIEKLNLSQHYEEMLRSYVKYAHQYRHAPELGTEREPPLPNEVEAFVYTTGLFIRLAIQQSSQAAQTS